MKLLKEKFPFFVKFQSHLRINIYMKLIEKTNKIVKLGMLIEKLLAI